MTKNVTTDVIAAIAILLLAACASPKNVAYIQNSDAFVADSSAFLYEAHIMPKDVLTITVNTVNPEISAPFNLMVSPTLGNASTGGQTVSSTRALQTYLVSNDGTISFPVLGTLKVGGLSKAECEQLIHDRIVRYLNGKEDPVVTVRMATIRYQYWARWPVLACLPWVTKKLTSSKLWHLLEISPFMVYATV